MRGKERARAHLGVQKLHRRPGQREAVEGRRSPAHLVEQNQRATGRRVQDGCRLRHFDHKSRAAARHIVAGAYSRINAVDQTEAHRVGGNETAHLRHQHQHCGLPQVGAFAAHIGPGHQQQARRRRRAFTLWRRFVRGAEVKIVCDEAPLARLFHPLFNHGMPRRHGLEHRLLDQMRTHIAPRCCQVRKTGQ